MSLYIVATPIGNLEDVTFRAIRVLKEADLILCEDTRVTRVLLEKYEIQKPVISYHQHSKLQKIDYIISLLKEGKNLALVSDAGTPGISDPGQQLIDRLISDSAEWEKGIEIVPIPGPSAVISALSISGFDTDEFLFLGFPPHKKGRQTFFQNVLEESKKRTVVFYESTHRIVKALEQMDQMDEIKRAQIVLCRELTKKFETVYRGAISEVLEKLKNDIIKGEFVVVTRSK